MTADSPSRLRQRRSSQPLWSWPADSGRYDRSAPLSAAEKDALSELGSSVKTWRAQTEPEWLALKRLVDPLRDARATLHAPTSRQKRSADSAVAYILHSCLSEGRTFWGWNQEAWTRVCGSGHWAFLKTAPSWAHEATRQCVIALAYLLGDFRNPLPIGRFDRRNLAKKVFGPTPVDRAVAHIEHAAEQLGYRQSRFWALPCAAAEAMLLQRSCDLSRISADALQRLGSSPNLLPGRRIDIYRLHHVLSSLDLVAAPTRPPTTPVATGEGVSAEWKDWVERWYATSTLAPTTRRQIRSSLFKVGRWLSTRQPKVQSPCDGTRQHCAAYIAEVDRWKVGDYTVRPALRPRAGEPLLPRAKANEIYSVRQFFRDCQEWDWLPRRFDPARVLRTPKSIQVLIGPDPRVIEDKTWAKLMWAGLNLEIDDFPQHLFGAFYPVEMVRAIALTWLFAGLRSDEIARLRVGCIRWQNSSGTPMDDSRVDADDSVCLLDVPTNKTGTAFTKPVEPLVGRAIATWETVRPPQPAVPDRKIGLRVDPLFCYRGHKVSRGYINKTLIPVLCRKAGVPLADARGRITSHRARATIASQLYNAKEPMSLFQLQAWLGHRSPESTQHYAKITPMTLAKAYSDAGYFARNVRAIEVLIDRDAVQSGAAASGTPWQHVDLGHGYCTYNFFEQCPHRMACARCEFYVPKESTQAQLLEAKDNLQRMMIQIPLTDDERAAVENDAAAIDRLLLRLVDVPTPAGPTPRELAAPQLAVRLPVVPSSRKQPPGKPASD